MASRIGRRLLAGIVIGLALGGALGVLLSTGRIGELEMRVEELEAVGPDADVVALQERIRGLTEELKKSMVTLREKLGDGGGGGPGMGFVLTVPIIIGSLFGGYLYSVNPTFSWTLLTGALVICTVISIAFVRDP